MSVKVTFRKNLPPMLHRSFPNNENDAEKTDNTINNEQAKNIHRKNSTLHFNDDYEHIQEIIDELDNMIGLDSVKKLIHELYAFVEIQKKREKEKLNNEPMVLHTIFSGNPGTGKTTVARLIGRLYKEMGVLSKGHIVECERADLVGEYIGHTANKTKDMVKKALGGVLFIDEAYSLSRGGEKDFGKESIDALVKAMEDHKDDLILILAGYKLEMELFIQTNPGLRSRFPIHIIFPDYTLDELMAIGEQMLANRQYEFSPEAKAVFRKALLRIDALHPYSGNARMVRNIVEKAIRKQAVRLYRQEELSREKLMLITEADVNNED